jgi:hypothetical protein
VTSKYIMRHWCWQLSLALVFSFLYCGLATHSAYAEDNGQIVSPQDTVSSNTAVKISPTLTLTLQDEDGQPISGVTVSAMAGNLSGKEKDRAQTDANGKAVFKHLNSGSYYFFANIAAIHSHEGYDFAAMLKEIKTTRSYFLSDTQKYDLSNNAQCSYTIKRNACIWFETFLDVFKSDKFVLKNYQLGIGQNIPMNADFIQIYLPMRSLYQIITVKDGDFDSWIIDFYAHENLKIELL